MTRVVYASEAGAILDSDVYAGGGTDDTAVLQSVLDKAPEWGGLNLIMDGAALVSGLRVHSDTTITCLNKSCGFFLKAHSNRAIVENADRNYGAIGNHNISLIGGTYNHNCREQEHHTEGIDPALREYEKAISASCLYQGTIPCFALRFTGVQNLLVRDITIRNQRTYAMMTENFRFVTMENIIIDLPDKTHGQNQDGLHFLGPGQFLTLRNISGNAGDDFIALAPDEHDGLSGITDVLIDGVFLDHADQGIRLLSRAKGRLDRVIIRNVTGTYVSYGFYINGWDFASKGNFGNILFENIDLRPEKPVHPAQTYRPPVLFQLGGCMEHLTFRNIHDHYSQNQRTLFEISSPLGHSRSQEKCKTHIDQLTIEGLTILNKEALAISPILVDGVVDRIILRNVDASFGKTSDTPLISFDSYGKVKTLALNGVIGEGITKLAEIPDGVVDNEILLNIYLPDTKKGL